ncbi:ribonuclease [Saccharopolyspora sp. K220]|uniref:ribonuclease n=1 Tax=Saccharopolyspora soli TaxID=2926618 RepID=UPI001F5AF609|nr:ribonuclease [Saccharopolyspora soli]MCI2422852.1 ribonuclease [Saccharopolyspora soli]
MKLITSKTVQILLASLLAVVGLVGFQASAWSVAPATAVAQAPCGDTSGFEQVNLSELPPEATDTVELIQQGGPYPYPQDGQVFQNREGILPDCEEGYYHEYTVETPGSDDRGARRFVVGDGGEYFYTQDHYETFSLTNIGA